MTAAAVTRAELDEQIAQALARSLVAAVRRDEAERRESPDALSERPIAEVRA